MAEVDGIRLRGACSLRDRWVGVAAAVIVAAAVAVTVVLLTHGPRAPTASSLPLASGNRIVAQRVTGNFIDETQPDQFRHLAIEGQPGESRTALIATEIATMRRHGWTLQRSTKTVLLRPGTLDYRDVNVASTAPGADVDLENQNRSIYAVMAIAHGLNIPDFAPVSAPQIDRAFRQHRPLLTVTLGNDAK